MKHWRTCWERENVKEKHQSVLSICAPIKDRTCNPGMCSDRESNRQPFSAQDNSQPSEALHLGWDMSFNEHYMRPLHSGLFYQICQPTLFYMRILRKMITKHKNCETGYSELAFCGRIKDSIVSTFHWICHWKTEQIPSGENTGKWKVQEC